MGKTPDRPDSVGEPPQPPGPVTHAPARRPWTRPRREVLPSATGTEKPNQQTDGALGTS